MVTRTATIRNRDGIHCRPSTLIIKSVEDYEGEITVSNHQAETNLKSIFELIGLALLPGDEVTVSVVGPAEEKVCNRLVELFETHFDFPRRKNE